MRIPTISKPEYQPCPNQCEKGCSIYATRPKECAEYSCHWLAEINVLVPLQKGHSLFPVLKEEERPDKCGVLLEWSGLRAEGAFTKATGIQFFHAREVVPGAFTSWRGKKLLDRLSKKHLVLLVFEGTKRAARGPPGLMSTFAKYTALLK